MPASAHAHQRGHEAVDRVDLGLDVDLRPWARAVSAVIGPMQATTGGDRVDAERLDEPLDGGRRGERDDVRAGERGSDVDSVCGAGSVR